LFGDIIPHVEALYAPSMLFVVCLIGFYIVPTHKRSYGEVPALLEEEDLRCLSVHYTGLDFLKLVFVLTGDMQL
jgi:hypothetical protein